MGLIYLFFFAVIANNFRGYQVKNVQMGGTSSTQIRKEKCIEDLVGKLSENCPPEKNRLR